MAKTQALGNFEQIVEKIIFNQDELEELKIAIRNFATGKTKAQDLKRLLLKYRGRMVDEITDFALFFTEKKTKELLQAVRSEPNLLPPTKVESQLREEIKEKNELLETVAKRVNKLASKFNNEDSSEQTKSTLNERVKKELERCLNKIGAKQWVEMCFYDDYKFFVKLYPKLEALYEERFGESEKNSKDSPEGKEIMANKMVKLGFPKDIETTVIKYIAIRNNFQHTMGDISLSNLELAREAFAKVFVYLSLNSIESKFLLKNREALYSQLTELFSKRLTGNPAFRKIILGRLKTVF